MTRVVLLAVAAYLAVGALLGLVEQPQQVWVCPDPTAPHGESSHSEKLDDTCASSFGLRERLAFFAVATVLWLPVVVLKSLGGG